MGGLPYRGKTVHGGGYGSTPPKSADVARRRDRPSRAALNRTIPLVARPSQLTPGSRVQCVTVGGVLAQVVKRVSLKDLSERLAYVRRSRHAYIQTLA